MKSSLMTAVSILIGSAMFAEVAADEYKLELQIKFGDGAAQVFTVDINGQSYNTDNEGKLVVEHLQKGMYVVTPKTPGFNYDPDSQHIVFRKREMEGVRFIAKTAVTEAGPEVVAVGEPTAVMSPKGDRPAPGSYELRVEVLRKDRKKDDKKQSFAIDVNGKSYTSNKDGVIVFKKLTSGAYVIKPTTQGFAYEPVTRTVYLKYREKETVRFYATPRGDVPSIALVVSTTSLQVPEGGSTTLTVKLDKAPRQEEVVAVSYSGDAVIHVAPTSLMFTSADWSTEKVLTVTSDMDPDTVGNIGNISLLIPNAPKVDVAVVQIDNTVTPPVVIGSHADRLTGLDPKNVTRTCLQCHMKEALDVWGSVHYQWLGQTGGTSNIQTPTGKIYGINDFCIYVGNTDANWIGKMVNLDGVKVDGGCARCHAGQGARPDPNSADTLQLENIDCLICHSPAYKRKVEETSPGIFRFVPDEAAMGISTTQAAADIQPKSRALCLRCHAKSGGGDNFKRGDIELAHLNPTRDFDVHMGVDGGNFDCTTCHFVENHRFAGRGVDMRTVDNAGAEVRCQNCHTETPHSGANVTKLNQHVKGVNCTVCHAPRFAKVAPTDMFRDWSKPGVVAASRLYEPWIQFGSNVLPEYKWWNGMTSFYVFGDPGQLGPNGRLSLATPNGAVNDPASRIYAMKHHLGNQPADPTTRALLPLKAGVFFQTGDITAAVQKGVEAIGQPYKGFEFMPTERYLGIFHEIAPKAQALACLDCHNTIGQKRLDFAALGYTPLDLRNGKPLCASCHEMEKPLDFQELHKKHVDEERRNCSECHTFAKRW